jgi:hypothetical protein
MSIEFLSDVQNLDEISFFVAIKVDDLIEFGEWFCAVWLTAAAMTVRFVHYTAPLFSFLDLYGCDMQSDLTEIIVSDNCHQFMCAK